MFRARLSASVGAIRSDAYTARLGALKEARRLVLEEHNLFVRLSHLIEQSVKCDRERTSGSPDRLYRRQVARLKRPLRAVVWMPSPGS